MPPSAPGATFRGSFALQVESPTIREIPGAVQIDFQVRGTIRGPALQGRLSQGAGSLSVDADGVGFLHLRGPLQMTGCPAILEASGRCDFGADGMARATSGALPRTGATLMVRLLTEQVGFTALNRSLGVGVGQIDFPAGEVELDLFGMAPDPAATGSGTTPP